MSISIKNLGAGKLNGTTAATPGPIAGKAWVVKSIILTNRDAVSRAVNVKITGASQLPNGAPSTTEAWIAPPAMTISGLSVAVLDSEITLQNPQALSIAATVAPTTAVDVVINGLERDV